MLADKPKTDEVFANFTANGIPQSYNEDLTAIVETVVTAVAKDFKVDESTSIKRLESRAPNHHSIFVRVKKGSPQHKILVSARGKCVAGRVVKQNCNKVHVNESHSSLSYRLFKKAKALKVKGYKYVWIREDKVFARKAEKEPKIRIFDDSVLENLLKPHS